MLGGDQMKVLLVVMLATFLAQPPKCEDELSVCRAKLVEEHNRALRCCNLCGQEHGLGSVDWEAYEEIVKLKKRIKELEKQLEEK